MPQVFTAFASEVKVNEETVEGLQSIEYSMVKNRQHVGAIGSDERIAVYFGMKVVTGKLRVASISKTLDGCLRTLSFLDRTNNLCQHGISTNLGGLHA